MDFLWIIILAGAVVWFLDALRRRKPKPAATMEPIKWFQTSSTDPATGDLITRFEAPNPATADMVTIRGFVDNELFIPKLERYLEIARETNAPAEVIAVIEDRIRRDDERDRRMVEQEMEELDREIEREIRREFRKK